VAYVFMFIFIFAFRASIMIFLLQMHVFSPSHVLVAQDREYKENIYILRLLVYSTCLRKLKKKLSML